MSDGEQRQKQLDPVETARQVHTLAQRLLQHVTSEVHGACETQPETSAESNDDDQTVTYWYP